MTFIRYLLPVLLPLMWVAEVLASEVAPIDLVSDAAAVCVEVQHPDAAFSKLQTSRLASRLKAFPPVRRFLDGGGFQKWTLLEEYVRRTTGKSLSEQLLAACSESLVLAIYLPEGKPPEGVVIAQAANAAALAEALRTWATLEPSQILKTKEFHGQTYVQRAKSANSGEIVYYVIFDRTIALSDHEHRIQQVIEFRAAGQQTGAAQMMQSLSELPLYKANRSQLPQDAVAFLFLNVREWDRVIDEGLRQSRDAAWILQIVNRVTALSAAIQLDDAVVVDVAADTSGVDLPIAWRQFVNSTGGGDDWTKRISTNAVIAISSRMDVTPWVQLWLASAADAKSEEFARGRNVLRSVFQGRDPFTEILPRVLRDWTVSLIPAFEVSTDLSPVDLVGDFSIGADPSLSMNLDQAIQFGMTLLSAALSHQRKVSSGPVLVKAKPTQDGVERWISGIKNLSPASLATTERLVLASSHQAIATRGASEGADAIKTSRLAAHEKQYFHGTSQLVWIDLVQLRNVVTKRGDWIASHLAADSTNDRQRIQTHLSRIEEIAKLFDAAFLAAKFDEQGVRVVFGAALDRIE
ncbi:MAG TPA: hypothetical protein VGM98_04225 [Schlesneria sp.]|jgi:hypothetical protein